MSPPYVTVRRCCPFSSASRQMGPARRSSHATRCARGAARRCVARSKTVWRSRCRCRHLGQTRTSKRMARPRSLPQPQPRVVWNAPSRGRTRNSNASGCPHSRRCPASRPSRQTSSRRLGCHPPAVFFQLCVLYTLRNTHTRILIGPDAAYIVALWTRHRTAATCSHDTSVTTFAHPRCTPTLQLSHPARAPYAMRLLPSILLTP